MKVFIVDDNPQIRQYLLRVLPELAELHVSGVATNVSEAVSLLSTQQATVNVLLLDVELPDGKGFEVLEQLPDFSGHVIFITSHERFALRAIKFSALDFLLKPIDRDELQQALRKAKEKQAKFALSPEKRAQLLRDNLSADPLAQKIILSNSDTLRLVRLDEIVRCSSEGSYTTFFLHDTTQMVVSKPSSYFEEWLPEPYFLRIHRSHLVNLHFFDRLDKKEGGTIHLKDGSQVPIAVRRRDLLLKALQEL
ncbi:MAG: LytTR family DNA-binding domain-containing protein [Bacteroidota bacterium]